LGPFYCVKLFAKKTVHLRLVYQGLSFNAVHSSHHWLAIPKQRHATLALRFIEAAMEKTP